MATNTGYKYGTPVFDTITFGSTGNWEDESMANDAVFVGTAYSLDGKAGVEVFVEVEATGGQPGDLTIEFFKSIYQTHGQKTLTLTIEVAEVQGWVWNFSAADFQNMLIKLTNSTGDEVGSTVKFTPFDIPATVA